MVGINLRTAHREFSENYAHLGITTRYIDFYY